MVIPGLDDVFDLVGLIPVEIDVVVRFADELALNGSLKLVSRQAH